MTVEHTDEEGPTRSITRNIGALLTSQVVTWVFAAVLIWIVPRYLGPDSYGSLRLATSFWMIAVVVATFGTSTLLTVEIARRRSIFRSLLRNSIRVRLSLYALIAPIVVLVLLVGPYERSTIEVAAVLGVGGLLMLFETAFESALHGLQEMGVTARIRVVAKLFLTVATVAVVLLGGRLLPVAVVTVMGVALTVALFARVVHRSTRHLDVPAPLAGRTLLIASGAFFAAEATRVVYQQIDTVVMSLLVDSEAIGYYAAADILFGSLLFVPVVVTTAMFPAIADLHARAPHEVTPLLARSFHSLLLVAVPIGLGTVVVAPSFVDLLYGAGFEGTVPVLAVFGAVLILSSQTILLGRFALATGRAKFWSTLMIAVTVLSIPLDLVLVSWTDQRFDNGAIGGALAYVVTEGLLIAVGLLTIGRGMLNRANLVGLLKVAVAGVAMLLAAWPLRDRMFVIPGAASVVVYVGVTVMLGALDEHEREQIRRLRVRLIQRGED